MRKVLFVASFLAADAMLASETDQFTTPRTPLYDIGPQLSRKVVGIIESGRASQDPGEILSRWVGRNFLSSRLARWVKGIRVEQGPLTFRPGPFSSIYRVAISPLPATFLFDSPTVHVHGYYMGTDKIDHFFQQGHQYSKLVMKHIERGADSRVAVSFAVAHGVRQEQTYFGMYASGVYSNGDLAANFAGMKFYLNLQHPVRIGDRVLPPLFERTPAGWRLRQGIDPDRILEPFLSNHLDESLNPSRYRFSRSSIRSLVRARCDRWMGFYADRLSLVAPAGHSFAGKWFGEDYGHWLPPADEISIATECGEATPSVTLRTAQNDHGHRRGNPSSLASAGLPQKPSSGRQTRRRWPRLRPPKNSDQRFKPAER